MNIRKQTNEKGVTLSAGVVTTDEPKTAKPVRASGKRSKKSAEPKVEDVPAPEAATVEQPAPTPPAFEEDTRPVVGLLAAPTETGTVIDPETGEAKVKVLRSIVPGRFKERYKKHGGTCGDDMALELKAATTMRNEDGRETLDWPALKAIAEANGIPTAAYESLNNGQKRMNVGNKLRGLLKAGKDVVVDKRVFRAEDYDPETGKKAAA